MTLASQSIAPEAYYSAKIYQQEQSAVFQKHWQFVGFTDELTEPNDFITKQIGAVPVLVQNIQGSLYALLNVCSHRKATLQTETKGNRVLRCPYHCWAYGKEGKLVSVPQERSDFAFTPEQKEALSLKCFELETCGNFVFVRVDTGDENAPSLESFLGAYYAVLQSLSDYFIDPIQSGQYEWKTNWKLAVETVLEVYHVPGVHPDSFVKLAKPSCEIVENGIHNTGITPLQGTPQKWWKGVRKHLKLAQHPELTEYNHFFIYPNLAIGLTNGSLMSVQTYEPIDETNSQLNFSLRMVKRIDGEQSRQAVKSAVQENFTSFNDTTLEEDRIIAESCQQNMRGNNQAGVLGKCEGRIVHFHQTWRSDLSTDNSDKPTNIIQVSHIE